MCKVIAFTNSSKLNIKKTSEVIGKKLLAIERDGYGYVVQGEENVFGERCIASTFTSRLDASHCVKLPIIDKRQSVFGYNDKPKGPALFHGRTSTNDKGLTNCHPMSRDNWHLIHNGVVTDHGEKYKKYTTNDSEDLLYRLTLGIKEVESQLTGYYAACAIGPDGRLHVIKDAIANLFIAWCPIIQSYIFATTESLIIDICKSLKIKHGQIDKVKDNCYLIFEQNELLHNETIVPRGYDLKESAFASYSLGRELTTINPLDNVRSLGRDYDSWDDYKNENYNTPEIKENLMREIETMDETYTIFDQDYNEISLLEFNKLDSISQALCTIERDDGSMIEPIASNY